MFILVLLVDYAGDENYDREGKNHGAQTELPTHPGEKNDREGTHNEGPPGFAGAERGYNAAGDDEAKMVAEGTKHAAEIGVITKADDIVCAVHAYKAGATKNVAMRFYYAGAAL